MVKLQFAVADGEVFLTPVSDGLSPLSLVMQARSHRDSMIGVWDGDDIRVVSSNGQKLNDKELRYLLLRALPQWKESNVLPTIGSEWVNPDFGSPFVVEEMDDLSVMIRWKDDRSKDWIAIPQFLEMAEKGKIKPIFPDALPAHWASEPGAGYLNDPHDELYPAIWDGETMRPEVKEKLQAYLFAALDAGLPFKVSHEHDWIKFTTFGSGASYNWDEHGDFDVHIWADVDAFNSSHAELNYTSDQLLAELRRVIIPVNSKPLSEITGEGKMLIQYYPLAGHGTKDECLATKPYACYDMETGEWFEKPKPLTPDFYADWFLLVEPKARLIATQASSLLDSLDLNQTDYMFWSALDRKYENPAYKERAEESKALAEQDWEAVRSLWKQLFAERQQAYSPEGEGINDERDMTNKILEVWGVGTRLKERAYTPLSWHDQELPEPKHAIKLPYSERMRLERDPYPKLNSIWRYVRDGVPTIVLRVTGIDESVTRWPQILGEIINSPRGPLSHEVRISLDSWNWRVENAQLIPEPDDSEQIPLMISKTAGPKDEFNLRHSPGTPEPGSWWYFKPYNENWQVIDPNLKDAADWINTVNREKGMIAVQCPGRETHWENMDVPYDQTLWAYPHEWAKYVAEGKLVPIEPPQGNQVPLFYQTKTAGPKDDLHRDLRRDRPGTPEEREQWAQNIAPGQVYMNSQTREEHPGYVDWSYDEYGKHKVVESLGVAPWNNTSPVVFYSQPDNPVHRPDAIYCEYLDDWKSWIREGLLRPVDDDTFQTGMPTHVINPLSKTATWADVSQKAQRLREQGSVHILRNAADIIVGRVDGDHGTYTTQIWRDDPNSLAITEWDCECQWSDFSWQRTRKWKKYEGRPCSHVLALFWQSLSQPVEGEDQGDGGQPVAPEGGPNPTAPPGDIGMSAPGMMNAPAPTPLPYGIISPGTVPAGAPIPGASNPPLPGAVGPPPAPIGPPPAPVGPPPGGAYSRPTQPGQQGTVGIPGALSSWKEADGKKPFNEQPPQGWQPDLDREQVWQDILDVVAARPQCLNCGEHRLHPTTGPDRSSIECRSCGFHWGPEDYDPAAGNSFLGAWKQAMEEPMWECHPWCDWIHGQGMVHHQDCPNNSTGRTTPIDYSRDVLDKFPSDTWKPEGWELDEPYDNHGMRCPICKNPTLDYVGDPGTQSAMQTCRSCGWQGESLPPKHPGRESTWKESAFANGDYVRAQTDMSGTDRDGNTVVIHRNSIGEVLASDAITTIAIFPLKQNAELEPHLVKVEDFTVNFVRSNRGNPFIRRRT